MGTAGAFYGGNRWTEKKMKRAIFAVRMQGVW